ncbi:MAG: hypothetical protein AB7W59_19450 [Acidimicrobiia bacterium]
MTSSATGERSTAAVTTAQHRAALPAPVVAGALEAREQRIRGVLAAFAETAMSAIIVGGSDDPAAREADELASRLTEAARVAVRRR